MIAVAALMVNQKKSDQESDSCRKTVEDTLTNYQMTLLSYVVLPDQRELIEQRLQSHYQKGDSPVILTLGGTGVRPTDSVPEVPREVVKKRKGLNFLNIEKRY